MQPEEIHRDLERLLAQVEQLAQEIRDLQRRLEDGTPEEEGSVAEPYSAVEQWLRGRGLILLQASQGENERWEALDPLVKQIGRSYAKTPPLQDLLAAVRRHQATGRPFTLDLSRYSADEIGRVTNIATQLHRLAILPKYTYSRDTKRIRAMPPRVPSAINFLTGGWFERYVFLETTVALDSTGISWDALFNVQVRFPSGLEAELDVLILPEGWSTPIWIEAKSGDYQQYIKRYVDIRQMLGIPVSSSFLVILGLPPVVAADLSGIHPLVVVNETQVIEAIRRLLNGESSRITHLDAGRIRALLRRRHIRPLGDKRRHILEAAVNVLPKADREWTLGDLVSRLAEVANVSNRAANDIVTALRRGGAFEITERKVHLSPPLPPSLETLEAACLRAYRNAIEEDYPGALMSDENRRAFERAVQPIIPLVYDE